MIHMTMTVSATTYLDKTNQWETVGFKKRYEALQYITTGMLSHRDAFVIADTTNSIKMRSPVEQDSVSENVVCFACCQAIRINLLTVKVMDLFLHFQIFKAAAGEASKHSLAMAV